MIIQHDKKGAIWHKVNDPVHAGLIPALEAAGQSYLNFPPVPNPPVPRRLDDNGKPVLGENGEPIVDMVPNGFTYVECNVSRDYILDGKITPRPELSEAIPELVEIVADGFDGAVVELPVSPFEIRVDGVTHQVEGGVLTFTSDMPAEYEIELVQWPYIEKTIKVIAHAAD